jgi:hypothetical protein
LANAVQCFFRTPPAARAIEKKRLKQNEWWKKWVVAWRARRHQQQHDDEEEEEGLILNEDDTSPSDPISSPVHSAAQESNQPASAPDVTSERNLSLVRHVTFCASSITTLFPKTLPLSTLFP